MSNGMMETPDPFKYVKIYLIVIDRSSEFGPEILEERIFDDEEYCEFSDGNAACGIALCSYLRNNCSVWNPAGIKFNYFPGYSESKIGYGVFTYEGVALFKNGRDCDLYARFYPVNINKYKKLVSK